MSQEDLKKFSEAAKNDPALLEELKKIGPDEQAIVELAKSKGYNFTVEELKSQAASGKGELSEEQLDKVAGGTYTKVYVTIVADIAVA